MNLAQAQQRLFNLGKQRDHLKDTIDNPLTVQRVGVLNWDSWLQDQRRKIAKLQQDIGRAKRLVGELQRNQIEARQNRLEERRRRLEEQSDPTLSLLADAFQLMKGLEDEGVELTDDEITLIDHIGIHLKEILGITSGSGVET
jgi:hypothetical protein